MSLPTSYSYELLEDLGSSHYKLSLAIWGGSNQNTGYIWNYPVPIFWSNLKLKKVYIIDAGGAGGANNYGAGAGGGGSGGRLKEDSLDTDISGTSLILNVGSGGTSPGWNTNGIDGSKSYFTCGGLVKETVYSTGGQGGKSGDYYHGGNGGNGFCGGGGGQGNLIMSLNSGGNGGNSFLGFSGGIADIHNGGGGASDISNGQEFYETAGSDGSFGGRGGRLYGSDEQPAWGAVGLTISEPVSVANIGGGGRGGVVVNGVFSAGSGLAGLVYVVVEFDIYEKDKTLFLKNNNAWLFLDQNIAINISDINKSFCIISEEITYYSPIMSTKGNRTIKVENGWLFNGY